MRNILQLFFNAEGISPWTVLLCLSAASIFEGIGFASLVPLLLVATDTGGSDASPWLDTARHLLESVGLSLTPGPLIIFFILTVMAKASLNFFAMQHVGNAIAIFSAGLRLQLIRNLFRARWSYLLQHPVGRIANGIGQAGRAGNAYMLSAQFLSQVVQTLVYLTVAFVVSWQLALAAMAIGGAMAWALHFLVRIARKAGWRQTQRTRELVTLLVDSLHNIKPLRAMAKEAVFVRFLERKVESVKKAIRREVISQQALKNGNEMLAAICMGAGFFVAIAIWQVPLVELVVVGILLKRTSNGIAKIQQLYQEAVGVEGPYIEVSALIAEAGETPEHNAGHLQASLEHALPDRERQLRPWRSPGPGPDLDRHPRRLRDRADGAVRRRQDHHCRHHPGPLSAEPGPGHGRRRATWRDRPAQLAAVGRLRAAGPGPVPRQHPCQCDPGGSGTSASPRCARPCRWRGRGSSSRPCPTGSIPGSARAAPSSPAASASASHWPAPWSASPSS